MLQRVAFHGQYGIGGLLEASDKDFKVRGRDFNFFCYFN